MRTVLTHQEDVPLVLEQQGSILSLDTVDLRPQKNGTIKEVRVHEGSDVQRGQLLFILDDRDDNANVQRAEAAVASAESALSIARRDLARTQDLANRNFVSPSALDTARNKVETAEAGLAQNKAAAEQARVSLSYTRITAPFDGRAGRVDIRPGALVTASSTQTPLVTITRMHPIGVSFSLPERDLPGLLAAAQQGKVKITAEALGGAPLKGELSFIDSAVDRTSGTIALKAKLDNSERRVWPGQYVNVKIMAGTINHAVVLPAQAVINGPSGKLVYVVRPDMTVEAKPVDLVRVFEQKAIITGLDANVKVVLEGAQNLRPGNTVIEATEHGGGKRKDKPSPGDTAATATQSAAK